MRENGGRGKGKDIGIKQKKERNGDRNKRDKRKEQTGSK